MPEPIVAYRICPLCEACCGLTVESREGRVAAGRGELGGGFRRAREVSPTHSRALGTGRGGARDSGLMFGHWLSIPVPDIERCDFLLMLGANPMASNGSLWTVRSETLRQQPDGQIDHLPAFTEEDALSRHRRMPLFSLCQMAADRGDDRALAV